LEFWNIETGEDTDEWNNGQLLLVTSSCSKLIVEISKGDDVVVLLLQDDTVTAVVVVRLHSEKVADVLEDNEEPNVL